MELKKMREMTEIELTGELEKMKKELFNLREVKRDIARVKTIIREKELEKVQA